MKKLNNLEEFLTVICKRSQNKKAFRPPTAKAFMEFFCEMYHFAGAQMVGILLLNTGVLPEKYLETLKKKFESLERQPRQPKRVKTKSGQSGQVGSSGMMG